MYNNVILPNNNDSKNVYSKMLFKNPIAPGTETESTVLAQHFLMSIIKAVPKPQIMVL